MMKRLFASMLFILLFLQANACLNFYTYDEKGREHGGDSYNPTDISIHPQYVLSSIKWYIRYIKTKESTEMYQFVSDYSGLLMKLGRAKEALPICQKLYGEHPGEYQIVANLGVAYELNGELDSAYVYLNKALVLNKHAHHNSEWVHKRILETAMRIRDEKTDINLVNILDIEADTTMDTGEQIAHQLEERIPLTPSKNDLLSKVIEECADHYRKNISLEWGIQFYAIALGYSSNKTATERIWTKLEDARVKFQEIKHLSGKMMRSPIGKEGWKKYIHREVQKWSGYQPYYWKNATILLY